MKNYIQKIRSNQIPSESETEAFISQFHDLRPGITEETYGAFKTSRGLTSYEELVNAVPHLNGKSILDLACGNGPLIEIISQRIQDQGQIIGVDFNATELALAQKRLKSKNIRFLCESGQNISVSSASMDVVFCHMALMLFNPIDKVIQEIYRILKPGGIFAATVSYIGTQPHPSYTKMRELLMIALTEEIPQFSQISFGDSKARSLEGLRSLFSSELGFKGNIDVQDLELVISAPPRELSEKLIQFFYFSDLLSEDGRKKLKSKWERYFMDSFGTDGNAILYFPLSRIVVKKN